MLLSVNYSEAELEATAQKILSGLTSKIVLFEGEMGVGKTTLIKELVRQLGNKTNVSSPTFSIVNEYEIDKGVVYHFDLYRIKDEEEALNFGIEDYLYSNEWVLIEWPEKLGYLQPADVNKIEIKLNLDGSRCLSLN